jgi:hypothetical protein
MVTTADWICDKHGFTQHGTQRSSRLPDDGGPGFEALAAIAMRKQARPLEIHADHQSALPRSRSVELSVGGSDVACLGEVMFTFEGGAKFG